jgi:uncharacterized protein (TIGR00661 family)
VRLLYGVVGEGMGHATRSRVLLEHLLARGHEVKVVVSGRAHGFLTRVFQRRPGISFEEIHGFHLDYAGNSLDVPKSLFSNLWKAPAGLLENLDVHRKIVESDFQPQAVISDFESWAYWFGINHFLPVISVDNMQVLNRCHHSDAITQDHTFDFQLAKAAVKVKLPGAYHYLITGFFFPPVRKPRTTLIPPILRPEILAARRERGEHVLVYQTAASADPRLVETLQRIPEEFRVYGLGREEVHGNVTLRAFSEAGFVEDLRTAKAVLANGGLSLMSECVHLGVPMCALPLQGQFEQGLNARWLAHLGYGRCADALDEPTIRAFLADAPRHEAALQSYVRRDNGVLFACVDELLRDIALGEPKPERLHADAPGKYWGPLLPEERD